jgi:hypothetical protein
VDRTKQPRTVAIFKRIWKHALSVFWVFFVTLSLFPGITGEIVASDHQSDFANNWFQIIMVVCLSCQDTSQLIFRHSSWCSILQGEWPASG